MTASREQILKEMGIAPLWREREPGWALAGAETAEVEAPPASHAQARNMDGQAAGRPVGASSASAAGARPASPPPAAARSGPPAGFAPPPVRAPVSRPVPAFPEDDEPAYFPVPDEEVAPGASQQALTVDTLDWPKLTEQAAACRQCGLCKQRKQAVFGVGDKQAEWLFIGEGPGAEEDIKGEPFVGQAGKLLDNMLAALDMRRGENVYIANAVKCRPPGNRTPEPAEMAACRPFLERQIALIEPKIIVLLGKPAAHTILGLDMQKPLGPLRGHRHEYMLGERSIPVVATYHPAYLLRNLPDKARAWEDLLYARRIYREETADRSQEALF